jgi:hypothetical protein
VKIIFANPQLSREEIEDLSGIEILEVETATQMHAVLETEFPATDRHQHFFFHCSHSPFNKVNPR